MHEPGRPADLDHPDRLWARAATLAVFAAAKGLSGIRVSDTGVYFGASGGSYWWQLTLAEAGEAVLTGQDSDASDTHLQPTKLDLLAGMPDRLIWDELREDHRDLVLGYVYWFVDGAWHRASYPDDVEDDGLSASIEYLASDPGVTEALVDWREGREGHEVVVALDAAVAALLERAHTRTVDAPIVTEFANALGQVLVEVLPPDQRPATGSVANEAFEVATLLGLTGTRRPPMLGDGHRS